jgi:hypothetical protein
MKEIVYIETSFVSLLVSGVSRDLTMAGNQQVTRDWWERRRGDFVCLTSQETLVEAARGDAKLAGLRLAALAGLPVVATTDEAAAMAEHFMGTGALPAAARVDALHLAVACWPRPIICSLGTVGIWRTHKSCDAWSARQRRAVGICPKFAPRWS